MRLSFLLICLLLAGCQTDFTGSGPDVSTTTPTKEQVVFCRQVMYINPDLEIEPLGYHLHSGMDDVIRFKFSAKTDDPAQLFDKTQVDSAKFAADFQVSALNPQATEVWWDVSSKKLSGGNFSVPPPNAAGTRGLNIGYCKNDDGTVTVYVLWHET
jgi:predicted small secreted protein